MNESRVQSATIEIQDLRNFMAAATALPETLRSNLGSLSEYDSGDHLETLSVLFEELEESGGKLGHLKSRHNTEEIQRQVNQSKQAYDLGVFQNQELKLQLQVGFL